jgi:hypothetical protein
VNRSANPRGPYRHDHEDRAPYVVTPVHREEDPFGWAVARDYLGFVLRAPRRHWVLAICVFVIVFATMAAVGRTMPERWQVQATILAQRNPLMSSLTNPGMSREWDAPTRAARELVIRRDNLIALAKKTDFADRYLASRAPIVRARDYVFQNILSRERSREELEEGLVDTLADRLWIVTGPEGTITFTFVWSDKTIAFDVVQAALQTFLDERYSEEIKVVKETIAILEDHDQEVQKGIAETVIQVEQKERELRIRTPVRRSTPALPTRIPEDADAARLQAQLESRRRSLVTMEDFRRSRLADLQAQLAQQRSVYAEDHPTVQGTVQAIQSLSAPSPETLALRGEIVDLEKEIAKRGGTVTATPLLTGTSSDELASVSMRLFSSEDPRLELERRRMEDLMHQHTNLETRIDAARVEMDTAQAAFKYRYNVIQPPQLPRKPLKPLGLLFILGGLMGGVAMALFAATVADLRAGRVVERWQVERALDLPVLGEIRR